MARRKGSLQLSGAIEPKVSTPLDSRMIVQTKADLTDPDSFPYAYVGMITAVQSEGVVYILKAKPTTVLSNWEVIGNGGGVVPSIQYSEMPEPSVEWRDKIVQYVGYHNEESEYITGFFYICEEVAPEDYEWTRIDTQPPTATRTDNFPVAGEVYLGLILQYDGVTNETYTHGYFYECVEDPDNLGEYIWAQINVQPVSEGGSEVVIDDGLSTTSTNPVQNKIITNHLGYITNSINQISSSILQIGGQINDIDAQLSEKQSSDLSEPLTIGSDSVTTVEDALNALNNTKIGVSRINEVNGVAGLDANGQLSPSQVPNILQYTEMPEASAEFRDKIIQYIGPDEQYKTGHFYACTYIGEDSYEWTPQFVQDVETGSGVLTKTISVVSPVGGISSGEVFYEGTPIEDIIYELLEPTLYPVLTDPSVTLSCSSNRLLEAGTTKNIVIEANFNRGTISPAYGTDGLRAGKAISYSWNGMTGITDNSFATVVSEANNRFVVDVRYEKGQQPMDSKGEEYDEALASGSVASTPMVFTFVDAWWSNQANISEVAKMDLIDKATKTIDIVFPAQTREHPEVFDIPASWSVKSISVKNDFSGAFDDARDQFSVTNITHNNIANVTVDYKRYTFNLGYGTGSRTIRITWS